MTRLVCASCHRSLLAATLTRGGQAFGPVCAKKIGLFTPKKMAYIVNKKHNRAILFEDKQMDLFDAIQENL